MQIKILPSSHVRDKMASVIKQLKTDGIPYFVTQYGKASAVLMSMDHYNELMARLESYEKSRS